MRSRFREISPHNSWGFPDFHNKLILDNRTFPTFPENEITLTNISDLESVKNIDSLVLNMSQHHSFRFIPFDLLIDMWHKVSKNVNKMRRMHTK